MPRYDYRCLSCGLQFEGHQAIKNRHDSKPCPDCDTPADPMVPTSVAGHFSKEVTGPVPQNTGIHDLDTHIDRVIGQHAQQGWGVAEGRKQIKEETLANNPGASGRDLSRNPDGSYRVLSKKERAAHERSQAIHEKATAWRRRKRRR